MDVEGEVVENPPEKTLGGLDGTSETEHGAAFWKKAKEHVVASRPDLEPPIKTQNGLKALKRTRASIHQCVKT